MCLSVCPVGLDYQSCPTSDDCENNPVDSFWKSASIQVILECTAGWQSRCGTCEEGAGGFRGITGPSRQSFISLCLTFCHVLIQPFCSIKA